MLDACATIREPTTRVPTDLAQALQAGAEVTELLARQRKLHGVIWYLCWLIIHALCLCACASEKVPASHDAQAWPQARAMSGRLN